MIPTSPAPIHALRDFWKKGGSCRNREKHVSRPSTIFRSYGVNKAANMKNHASHAREG